MYANSCSSFEFGKTEESYVSMLVLYISGEVEFCLR